MSNGRHVVFGAGQVGGRLAAELLAAGHRVRVVKRTSGGIPPGAEPLFGDAADPGFCLEAVAGATVVYHCMNPEYSTAAWARLVPLYMENLVRAAGRTGARLVVLDNLYMIGKTGGRPITEDTPMNPRSRKGEIRARTSERLFEACRRGDVMAVSGRASDFYGPGGAGTHFGSVFWKPVFKGRPGQMLINPDAVHTYHYIPDVARSLAILGQAPEDVLGGAWMLPCTPAGTAHDLIGHFSNALGTPIAVTRLPRPLIRLAGLFLPILKEIGEMLYQWDEPFVVDDSRFRARFGTTATDPADAAAPTVAWARSTYAA
jgi:nucleoside-diphosphate-sugar epimerase